MIFFDRTGNDTADGRNGNTAVMTIPKFHATHCVQFLPAFRELENIGNSMAEHLQSQVTVRHVSNLTELC